MKSTGVAFARFGAAMLLAVFAFLPDASAVQQCVWRGTAPFCAGKCKAGEKGYERGLSGYAADGGADCWTGSKILCCREVPGAPCPSGLVWAERFDGDTACVAPAVRDANRRARGLSAPCPSGQVWAEKFDGDTTCVSPAERDANRRARGLSAPCPSGQVWAEKFDGDTTCVSPAERDANRRARGLPPAH